MSHKYKNQYRAAIIGLGNIAWKFDINSNGEGGSQSHAGALVLNPYTEIVGGSSPDNEDGAGFAAAYGVPVYKTVDKMLEELEPDLVSICSPTPAHYEQMARCIERQVPMLWLEKPPTTNTEQLENLIQLRASLDDRTTVLVNYQRRYTESYIKLRQAMNESVYGPCRLAQVQYTRGLHSNGSHLMDIIFYIFDNMEYSLQWVEFGECVNPCFSFNMDNRLRISVTGVDLPYHSIDVSLVCEKGRLSVLHGGMTTRVEEVVEHENFKGFYRLKEVPASILGEVGFLNSIDNALKDLLEAHHNQREPLSNLKSAFRSQKLVEDVLKRACV